MRLSLLGSFTRQLTLGILLLAAHPALSETAPLQFTRLSETVFNGSTTVCALMSDTMNDDLPVSELTRYLQVEDLTEHHPVAAKAAVLEGQFCFAGLSHGHTYRFTLKQGLTSKNGSKLSQDVTREVKIGDAKPQLSVASGNVLAKTMAKNRLTVKSVNVSKLRVFIYRIGRHDNATSQIFRRLDLHDTMSNWEFYELISQHASLAGDARYEVGGAHNEEQYTDLDLTEFLEKREQGTYLIFIGDEKLRFNGQADDTQDLNQNYPWLARLIYVTDLGVTVYSGRENGISVAVHSLTDVSSIIGAKVRLIARNNTVLATTNTNSDGFASFSPKYTLRNDAHGVAGVEVESGSDYIYTDLRGSPLYIEQDYSNLRPAYPEPPKGQEVFAYTDRGIYRPGETIHYVALIRDKQLSATTQEAMLLTVRRPDGMVYDTYTLTNQGAGAFATDFTTPPRGLQGSWNFELGEDEDTPYSSINVSVQDFVPSHLQAVLETPQDTVLKSGTAHNAFKFSASFNYGSPAVGVTAGGSVTISPDPHPLEQFKNYYFGPDSHRYGELNFSHYFDNIALDAQGQGQFELSIPEAGYARRLDLNVDLYDGTSQGTSLSSRYRIETTVPLVGVRQVKDQEGQAGLNVISVTSEGQPAPQSLDYKLFRLHVDYQYVFKDNTWQYLRVERKVLLSAGTVEAALNQDAILIPAPTEQGEYECELRGEHSATTFSFYEGYRGSLDANTPDSFVLSHDKALYAPGDTVTLEFDSLYEGNSVLAIGSQGVTKMSHYPVKKGHNLIQFKADESLGQGAHVLLTTYAPLDEHPNVARSVGLTYLAMDSQPKKLGVSVKIPSLVRPEQTLEIPVEIQGSEDQVYLTAALVDEGILSLTDFVSPRPEVELFRPRMYRTSVHDLYGYLMRQVTHQDHGHGGMDALASLSARTLSDLSRRNVALFSGIVRAEQGKATLHFEIPKHQGSLRLMLVAYDQHKLGSAAGDIIVRDKAVVRAEVPYVVHAGDSLQAALRVHNLELETPEFELQLKCEGVISCALAEDQVKPVLNLKQGEQTLLPLKLKAEGVGFGTLSFRVQNGSFSYSDELKLEVAPQIPEAFSQSIYLLQPGQQVQVKAQEQYLPGALVSVTKGSLPYVDSKLFKEELYKTDGAFGYDLIAAIDAALHTDFADQEQMGMQIRPHTGKIQDLIYALTGRVSDLGLLSTIEQTGAYDPFATALGFKVLCQARQAGFDVPPAILSCMLKRLDELSRELDNPAVCAYALEALTLYGELTLASLRYQFDEIKPLSALANIGYARAFKLNGDKERMTLALQRGLAGVESLIDDTRKLQSLPKPQEQLKLLATMLERENVPLSSVQYDLAELIDAALYCQNSEIFTRAVALLTSQESFKYALTPSTMASLLRVAQNLPPEEHEYVSDKQEILLKNDSQQSVNYTVGMLGYPKEIPQGQQGLSLEVAFYLTDGTPLRPPYELKQHEFVTAVCTLKRKTPIYHTLNVRGMLPTGFNLEKVIYQQDQALNHYGELFSLINLQQADLGFIGQLEENNRQELKFALLLRPAVKGELMLPALQISDSRDPGLTVFSKPQKIKVK